MPELNVLPQFRPLYEDNAGVILAGGRARGASTAMAQAVVYWCSQIKIKIGVYREFQESIEESAKAQIEEVIQSDPEIAKDWICTNKYLMHKRTQATVIFKGLRKNKNSIKSTVGLQVAIIEEAEDLEWESWKILEPTVRHPEGTKFVLIGNPKDRASCFGQMITDPPPGFVVVRSTYLENPYVSDSTRAQAEACRQRDINEYNWIWMGQFRDVGLRRIVTNIRLFDGSQPLEPDDATVGVGVDVARDGGDDSCICVRKGRTIVELKSFRGMDLPQLVGELSRINRIHKPSYINVDSTGHGAWVPDALRGQGIRVESINFASAADEVEKYSNKRTELYGAINDYCSQGGTLPNDHQLLEELEASYYELDHKNRMQLIPKDDIKGMIKRSPDRADAVGLACYSGGRDMFRDPNRNKDLRSLNKLMAGRLLSTVKW